MLLVSLITSKIHRLLILANKLLIILCKMIVPSYIYIYILMNDTIVKFNLCICVYRQTIDVYLFSVSLYIYIYIYIYNIYVSLSILVSTTLIIYKHWKRCKAPRFLNTKTGFCSNTFTLFRWQCCVAAIFRRQCCVMLQ